MKIIAAWKQNQDSQLVVLKVQRSLTVLISEISYSHLSEFVPAFLGFSMTGIFLKAEILKMIMMQMMVDIKLPFKTKYMQDIHLHR